MFKTNNRNMIRFNCIQMHAEWRGWSR